MASDPTIPELGRLVEHQSQAVTDQIETEARGGEGLTRVILLKRASFAKSPKPGIQEAGGEHCPRLGEWVRQCSLSAKSGRLCYLLTRRPGNTISFSEPQFLHPQNGDNNRSPHPGLWLRAKAVMYVKSLAECLVHRKCSIEGGYSDGDHHHCFPPSPPHGT